MGSRAYEYDSFDEALRALQKLGHIALRQGHAVECPKCGETWFFAKLPDDGVTSSKRPEECA